MTDKATETFLAPRRWTGKLFLGGWNAGTAGTLTVTEPATGDVLGHLGEATSADVAVAAQRAHEAQKHWLATPERQKIAILLRVATLLEEQAEEIIGWIIRETGSIRPKAELEINETIAIFHQAAGMIGENRGLLLPSITGRQSYAKRVPHGVVGVISPFNVPLILAARAVAPALATGNAVILKPDPRTSVAGGVVLARLFEEAGLPADAFHLLPGGADLGAALVEHPLVRMISFTGSTRAGRSIGEACGRLLKRASLELGGKSPLIVLEDADVEQAASNAAMGAFLHQGQICMASGRILVQERIADAFAARLAEKASHLPVGNPATDNVALGPLISAGQRDRVHEIVRDAVAKGAKLAAGGSFEGLFYRATVLYGVKPGMRAYGEEVFGPVANVIPFGSDEEAVSIANDTEYGLSSAVFSPNLARAMAIGDKINSGILHINDQTVSDEIFNPFGGRGASGNGGNTGGPANWDLFTQWRWVTVEDKPSPKPF